MVAGRCLMPMTMPFRRLDGLPLGVLAFKGCWDAS
jgi:hypothetical protein